MKDKSFIVLIVISAAVILTVFSGCDRFKGEIPPENLPPLPEDCKEDSSRLDNALLGAYTTGEVSQIQIAKFENRLADCLQEAGLSRSEAKGIIKEQENAMKKEADQSPQNSTGMFPF